MSKSTVGCVQEVTSISKNELISQTNQIRQHCW